MRIANFACLIAVGLFQPCWCLAQATDEARIDREMQEDVEVLQRIVTETVRDIYQKADQRALLNCKACHAVPEGFGDRHASQDLSAAILRTWMADGTAALPGRNPHAQVTRGIASKAADGTAISGLANYVPGQGIVVQLEAPAPVVDRDVKRWLAADEAVPKRWDALLRETRGEPEKKSALSPLLIPPEQRRVHRLILTEKVVEVLAENGRNLRHVKPDERVTVAFTFPAPSRESRERERATFFRHYFGNVSSGASGSSSAGPGARSGSGSAMGSAGAGSVGAGSVPSKPEKYDPQGAAQNQVVTGDLLMRQQSYVEAIAAYEKALAMAGVNPKERAWDPNTGESHRPMVPAAAAETVRKLIQAQVAVRNFSEAKALMQWLEGSQASSSDERTALRRIYLDLVGVPPTPDEVKIYFADKPSDRRERLVDRLLAASQEDEGPSRVPARMVISCTRQQLDDVATGKLTKLDFAGRITLKYSKGLAAEKKDPPAKK